MLKFKVWVKQVKRLYIYNTKDASKMSFFWKNCVGESSLHFRSAFFWIILEATSWFTWQNISVTQDTVSAHPWDYEKWRGAEKTIKIKDAFTANTFGSSQRSNIAGLKKSSTLSIWKSAVTGKHTTDKITFQLSVENMQFKEWCYPG